MNILWYVSLILAFIVIVLTLLLTGTPYEGFDPTIVKERWCESLGLEFRRQSLNTFECIDSTGLIYVYDKKILRK